MVRRRFATPAQTRLIRTYPYGRDPAVPGLLGMPTPLINTVRFGIIGGEGGKSYHGNMQPGPAGVALSNGQFTVANNDFTTGLAVLVLGEYLIRSNIDFIPGVGVAATATAVAAAINRLPGFSASALGAVVTVEWGGTIDEVDFYATHYGTITNFTPLIPNNGRMAMGRPAIAAPELTP